MLDNTTYLLTQNNPGGPILRPAEPLLHDIDWDETDDRPLTRGRMIGGLISMVLIVGVGIYLFLTL